MKRNKTMSENSRPTRFKDLVPRWQEQSENFKKKFLRGVVHAFAWTGMAVLYYFAFSIFFDTPLEYEMKHSTRRYDTIEKVLMNVIDRDRSVFRTLFESDPYNFDTDFEKKKWEAQEKLLTKSNKELGKLFLEKLRSFEKRGSEQLFTLATLEQAADSLKDRFDNIPAIQPVINKQLTLLTASTRFTKVSRPIRESTTRSAKVRAYSPPPTDASRRLSPSAPLRATRWS